MQINNVYINQGLKVPVVPGQNKGDAITVGFLADGTPENIQNLMAMYGAPMAREITIGDMTFETLLEKDMFLLESIKKYPKLKFRLSCYYNSADDFMKLMGTQFTINTKH